MSSIVEYTDPSNVYSTISQDLLKRLPLRNLHWNSSSRPLRSIKSLHVDLVPDDRRLSQHTSPQSSRVDLTEPHNGTGEGNNETTKSKERPASGAASSYKKERRHQIPGLRQTPYLKLYLLRCEDIDSYKNKARKPLREWVKEHTPPSQKSSKANNQENHDAFEWLILHVISPEDRAAQSTGDGKASSKRDPSQLVEKIRSDFNEKSKSAVDRVAQVQINEGRPGTTPLGQGPEDGDTGWGDLIFKLKSLILASFDLRVRQYEEDLKEKESQRSLPGWNFNTFFVLKEGLARGFESVGLVEDALTSYQELSVGLQTIIEGKGNDDSSPPTADTLTSTTDDLVDEYGRALTQASAMVNGANGNETARESAVEVDESPATDFGGLILDTERKPFRNLILSNKISAFDFQCYIFARQISLLLRLANASSLGLRLSSSKSQVGDTFDKYDTQSKSDSPFPRSFPEAENLLLLADICSRAVEFIINTSAALRCDLERVAENLQEKEPAVKSPVGMRSDVVDNLVASWISSVADCVLQRTLTQSLHTQLQPLLRQLQPHKHDDKAASSPSDVSSFSKQSYPTRTSSLSPTIARPPSPEKFPSVTALDAVRLLPPGPLQTGSKELAAQRAGLLSLKRQAIGLSGYRCGQWKAGFHGVLADQGARNGRMQDVSLNEKAEVQNGFVDGSSAVLRSSVRSGLRNAKLHAALYTMQAFYEAFEDITASALALYVLGERKRSAQALTAEMAAMRFQMKDFPAAASYFRQLAPFYAQGEWKDLELVMLDLYVDCLKRLERNEEYVGIGLKILAKLVERMRGDVDGPRQSSLSTIDRRYPDTAQYLEDIVRVSKTLDQSSVVRLEDYFDPFSLDPRVRHQEGRDGFEIQLQTNHIMQAELQAEEVQIRLVSVQEDNRHEFWLSKRNPALWKPGAINIVVESQTMQPGLYAMKEIVIRAGNVTFQHDASVVHISPLSVLQGDTTSFDPNDSVSRESCIHVYPQPGAFEARLAHCKDIHLEKIRSIEITLSSGWNTISGGQLAVRSGTAGLRLHTAEAAALDDPFDITVDAKPGAIRFGAFDAETEKRIKIPYTLESDLKEIIVRLEITYKTEHGDYTFTCAPKISILLPVGVNVQDIFSKEALFSKFSVFTANSLPLRLLHCELEGTDDFDVLSPPLETGLDIFSRQPISLLARVTRKSRDPSDQPLQRKLLLHITYTCFDEESSALMSHAFASSLSASSFSHLSQLLLPIFRASLSLQDLETAALLRSVDIPTYSSTLYSSMLPSVASNEQQALLDYLRDFHAEHTSIALPLSTLSTPNTLTIPVEVPTLSVLHTASLTLPSASATTNQPISLNSALPAELRLSHTRAWGPDPAHNGPLDFVYEVSASADHWLIGGQRKARFSAREDEEMTFPLLLLPQRTGHLLYPSVEIKHLSQGQEDEAGNGDDPISCETDYKSQSKSVSVVAGLERTTMAVDHEAPGNGAWALEAKAWGEV